MKAFSEADKFLDMMSEERYVAREFPLIRPYKIGERKRIIKEIPEGHALVRPIVAGICGSDILYFKGYKEERKLKERLPMCLLHEGVVEIIDVGKGVAFEKGQKAAIMPLIPCNRCVVCRRGLGENMCLNPRFLASTSDGLARTLLVYPADRLIPLPSGIDLKAAALAEPISIALNAIEAADITSGKQIAVIGDGTIAYLLTLILSHVLRIPKNSLHVFGIVDEKLHLFSDLAHVVNTIQHPEKLEEMHNHFDLLFEAVGGRAQEKTLDQALDLLMPGGKLIILGISAEEKIPLKVQKIVRKCLTIKGSFWSRMDHFMKAVELLKDKSFEEKVKRAISSRSFKLKCAKDLEEALRYADSEEGAARYSPGRVLVYFE